MDSDYVKTSMRKLKYVSNSREVRGVIYDFLIDGSQWLSERRRRNEKITADSFLDENNAFYLNVIWIIRFSVVLLLVSILLRSFWILIAGIWLILADQIISKAFDWLEYALDDPELSFAYRYIRGWLRRVVKESDAILNNEAAWKMGMAHAFLRQVPTGISVIRHWIFYRAFELRDVFLTEELGASRHISQNRPKQFLPHEQSWSKRYRGRKKYVRQGDSDRSLED